MKDILIIMTGGTIDAEPYADPANPPKNAIPLESSLIPKVVAELGHGGRCDFLRWRAKDSKAFTAEEMDDLAKIIRTSKAKYVIITHGTDVMPEHSRQILGRLSRIDAEIAAQLRNVHADVHGRYGKKTDIGKTVVFTGAMMPLANGPGSDGYRSLAHIFENIDRWPQGVRVVMHGKSFDPVGLVKNFASYTFEGREISGESAAARHP